jgi:isoquinoline 1-oxidoreductase subunit alpha
MLSIGRAGAGSGSLCLRGHLLRENTPHPSRQTRKVSDMARLNINGRTHDVQAEAETPLLWVIREQVGLTGTKYGCGVAQCGACSVHIDGVLVRSCSLRVGDVKESDRIVTIEGLSPDSSHPVQRAWAALDVPQCGYCQSGQIMAAVALLKSKPKPSDADIDEAMTNICRCGTYQRIRAAVHMAAGRTADAGPSVAPASPKSTL